MQIRKHIHLIEHDERANFHFEILMLYCKGGVALCFISALAWPLLFMFIAAAPSSANSDALGWGALGHYAQFVMINALGAAITLWIVKSLRPRLLFIALIAVSIGFLVQLSTLWELAVLFISEPSKYRIHSASAIAAGTVFNFIILIPAAALIHSLWVLTVVARSNRISNILRFDQSPNARWTTFNAIGSPSQAALPGWRNALSQAFFLLHSALIALALYFIAWSSNMLASVFHPDEAVSLAHTNVLRALMPLKREENFSTLVAIALAPGVLSLILLIFIAPLLEACARALFKASMEEMVKSDRREPILFLRAFKDDQVKLMRSARPWLLSLMKIGYAKRNLDQLILMLASRYGPVVALGNPSEKFPPYGAARAYFDNRTWQQAVERLCAESDIIIVCVDDSPGIWWELDFVFDQGMHLKTLFILHPRLRDLKKNEEMIKVLVGRYSEINDAFPDQLCELSREAVLGFFWDRGGEAHWITSKSFGDGAYEALLKWFICDHLRDLFVYRPRRQLSLAAEHSVSSIKSVDG